jgi:hypothetical protein
MRQISFLSVLETILAAEPTCRTELITMQVIDQVISFGAVSLKSVSLVINQRLHPWCPHLSCRVTASTHDELAK